MEDWNCETIFYGHYRSVFNHCDVIGGKANEFGEKMQNKAIMPFKVIEVGINQMPVFDFLLVINTN